MRDGMTVSCPMLTHQGGPCDFPSKAREPHGCNVSIIVTFSVYIGCSMPMSGKTVDGTHIPSIVVSAKAHLRRFHHVVHHVVFPDASEHRIEAADDNWNVKPRSQIARSPQLR